ncbi:MULTISPECIES: TetR/AcrR family transcriptional regulator [Kaistia]|uniref:TetR/AcrR family transcriptional regulator n=1 Tax=Kaistia nematophila TaxID=2994654 RepID=A0A9X3E4L3_9HYPH|nr:TetR/AcrR family transcriptional regulator [Kaistia nematophila]MCX5570682.1 TetR/AcrR family transcriptional regulator [Kaistia nematophila]
MDVKSAEQSVHSGAAAKPQPPRERILVAARELFGRHGVHGVGVETIAEAAGTNKMTLYRHFESKDLLVAEYLRGLAAEGAAIWCEIETEHPGQPLAQIDAWLTRIANHVEHGNEAGCALAKAAVQITDPDHPGREVLDANTRQHRDNLIRLCRASDLAEPELLADQLFLLIEGSRVTWQHVGDGRPGADLPTLAAGIIASHRR